MSDLVPKGEHKLAAVSDETDAYLRADAIVEAINANLPKGSKPLKPIPKDFKFYQRDRAVVKDAIDATFQLLGGVPALLRFAETNPKEFFTIWSKLLPPEEVKQAGTTVIVQSAVPTNSLDFVSVDEYGRVIHVDGTRQDDEVPE